MSFEAWSQCLLCIIQTSEGADIFIPTVWWNFSSITGLFSPFCFTFWTRNSFIQAQLCVNVVRLHITHRLLYITRSHYYTYREKNIVLSTVPVCSMCQGDAHLRMLSEIWFFWSLAIGSHHYHLPISFAIIFPKLLSSLVAKHNKMFLKTTS